MIPSVDSSEDGEVDFEEFVVLMEKRIHNVGDDPVILAFRDFDKNDNGKIINHEFRYILAHVDENRSDEEIDNIFRDCQLKEDEDLPYEDFDILWRTHKKINLMNIVFYLI